MSLFLQQSDGNSRWGIWKLDETPEELLGMLSAEEAPPEELLRLKASSRRREWLAVRVLLHRLVGEGKQIVYYPSGKPCLKDYSFAISISHTKGYAAVLVRESDKRVGIDIEQCSERVQKVTAKFLRPDEHPTPFCGSTLYSTLLHWSAKETLFKCLDSPPLPFYENVRILPFSPFEQGVLEAEVFNSDQSDRFQIFYRLFPDFVLTINM